jgi:hypothetical protein
MVEYRLQTIGPRMFPYRTSEAKPKRDKPQGPKSQGEFKGMKGFIHIIRIASWKMEDKI